MGEVTELQTAEQIKAENVKAARRFMPRGLDKRGRALWRHATEGYSFRFDELEVLGDACREADLIEQLHAATTADGFSYIVAGSMGQPRVAPLVSEIRLHRATLARLLAQLHVEDLTGKAKRARSASAREAGGARWKRSG